MKLNQLKLGVILSFSQTLVNILVGIAYTPVMLRLLGQSEYGLYSTIVSAVSMLSVVSLGLNGSYIKFYSKYKANDDDDGVAGLNGLYLIIYSVLGLIVLIAGLFLTYNLELVFDEGLTPAEYGIARILMVLLTINMSATFIMTVFTSVISANEKYVFLKLLGMGKTILGPLLTLPLLLMGFRSIAMVSVIVSVSLAVDVVYCIYCRRFLHMRFKFRGIEKGLLKSLLTFTSFIAICVIVDQINNHMGKFLLGRFSGTRAVAVYAVAYTLYSYYSSISYYVSNVFTPRIHNIVNSTNDSKDEQRRLVTELFTKIGRIQFLLLALIATGLVLFGKAFIEFWAGSEYSESYSVIVILVILTFTSLIQNSGVEIQCAKGEHKFRSYAYVIMALLNLTIAIVLCPRFGVIGAALGMGIATFLINGVAMNIQYYQKCNIDILSFWTSILSLSKGLIIPLAAGLLMVNYMYAQSLAVLAVEIVAYTMIYAVSMWFFGMNQYERALIKRPIGNIIDKYRHILKRGKRT